MSSSVSVPPKPGTLLPEHSLVRLRLALPASGLPAGAVGTIIHIYEGAAAYEVEFTGGRSPTLEALRPADVEA